VKAYDNMMPYREEQWERNEKWIVNRCLFLINLKDQNNELFHGGDARGETAEQIMADIKKREKHNFYIEYMAMRKKYPKQFERAFYIWVDKWDSELIEYLE
jgi:hypothetical protein